MQPNLCHRLLLRCSTGIIMAFLPLLSSFSLAQEDKPHTQTEIIAGHCYIQQDTVFLDLNTNIFIGQDPLAALKSGLTLHFLYEFNIKQDGKWFAQSAELERPLRLRYNPVAQTFVYEDLITLQQVNHHSLEETLSAIGSLQALPLLDVAQLPINEKAERVRIKARFLLNEALLPVSMRFSALIDSDWDIKSGWWSCLVDV